MGVEGKEDAFTVLEASKTGISNLRGGGTGDWKERGLERHQRGNPADTARKAMQGQQERPTVLKIDHQRLDD